MRMRTAIAIALIVSSIVGASLIGAGADDVDAANSIKVVVLDYSNNVGEVDCALFAGADGFPSDSSKAKARAKEQNREWAGGVHFARCRAGRLCGVGVP